MCLSLQAGHNGARVWKKSYLWAGLYFSQTILKVRVLCIYLVCMLHVEESRAMCSEVMGLQSHPALIWQPFSVVVVDMALWGVKVSVRGGLGQGGALRFHPLLLLLQQKLLFLPIGPAHRQGTGQPDLPKVVPVEVISWQQTHTLHEWKLFPVTTIHHHLKKTERKKSVRGQWNAEESGKS